MKTKEILLLVGVAILFATLFFWAYSYAGFEYAVIAILGVIHADNVLTRIDMQRKIEELNNQLKQTHSENDEGIQRDDVPGSETSPSSEE